MTWVRRRQARRATVRAARLFVALERLSAGRPPGHLVTRASLSAHR